VSAPTGPAGAAGPPGPPWPPDRNPGIEAARVVALAAIVLAHFKPWATGGWMNTYASVMEVVSSQGVPVFFALSGYLFKPRPERSWPAFVAGRRYLLPWAVCATAVYLFIVTWSGSPYDPGRHLTYALGAGSIYFYLTLLFVFELFTRAIRNAGRGKVAGAALVLALVSTSYAALLVVQNRNGYYAGVSPFYLLWNPFNFYVYYALGRLLAADGVVARAAVSRRGPWLAAFLVLLALNVAGTWWLVSHGRPWLAYFWPAQVLLGVSAILVAHGRLVAPERPGWLTARLAALGVYAFPVYLLHAIPVVLIEGWFRRAGIPVVPWHLAAILVAIAVVMAGSAGVRRVLPGRLSRALIGV